MAVCGVEAFELWKVNWVQLSRQSLLQRVAASKFNSIAPPPMLCPCLPPVVPAYNVVMPAVPVLLPPAAPPADQHHSQQLVPAAAKSSAAGLCCCIRCRPASPACPHIPAEAAPAPAEAQQRPGRACDTEGPLEPGTDQPAAVRDKADWCVGDGAAGAWARPWGRVVTGTMLELVWCSR